MVKVELQQFVTISLTGMTLEEARAVRDQIGKVPWGTPVLHDLYHAMDKKIKEVEGV